MGDRISTKIHEDAWERVQEIGRALGISGISTLRALSYAKPEECAEFEKRRLEAVTNAAPTRSDDD